MFQPRLGCLVTARLSCLVKVRCFYAAAGLSSHGLVVLPLAVTIQDNRAVRIPSVSQFFEILVICFGWPGQLAWLDGLAGWTARFLSLAKLSQTPEFTISALTE